MADIINFFEAKSRLRPETHTRGFLIIELPEDVAERFESANPPIWHAHIDFLID